MKLSGLNDDLHSKGFTFLLGRGPFLFPLASSLFEVPSAGRARRPSSVMRIFFRIAARP